MLSVRKSRYGCTREVWRARDTSYQPSSRAALHATDRVFFAPIYGPNRAEKTRLVFTANSYVINQQNFLRHLHLALKGDVRWTKSV